MPGPVGREPRSFVADGAWPDAALIDDAPPQVVAARMLAINVRDALDGQSLTIRKLAARVDVDHTTISRILGGRRYCDVATLAKLEAGLDVSLWPTYRSRAGHADLDEV